MLPNTASLERANPHLMDAIVSAGDARQIVASRDIFDDRGVLLWAREQPVSRSLQQRLLDRKLREPIEACLRAEDGFTNVHLLESLRSLLASEHALTILIRDYAAELESHAASLPLHASVQLLLTISAAARPHIVEHAVRGMALAGAMALSIALDRAGVRVAMLAGLLHDLGEMYVDPKYLDVKHVAEPAEFRNIAVHPLVSAQLLQSLTDYPLALAKGIAEHHERLDGTGYPSQSESSTLGAIGRFLAVVEATLGIVGEDSCGLARASFALRLVPGEFDSRWTGFIFRGANRTAPSSPPADARDRILESRLLLQSIQEARVLAADLAGRSAAPANIREAGRRAQHRISRLDVAARSVGLGEQDPDGDPAAVMEQIMAINEIRYRLRSVRRECIWPVALSTADDQAHLQPLWTLLAAS